MKAQYNNNNRDGEEFYYYPNGNILSLSTFLCLSTYVVVVVESRDGGGMKGGDKVEVDLVFCIVLYILVPHNRQPAATSFYSVYSGFLFWPGNFPTDYGSRKNWKLYNSYHHEILLFSMRRGPRQE